MWRQLLFQNKRIKQGVRRSLASRLVRINPDTGLIDLAPDAYAMPFDGNWLFFGHNTASRDCFLWHTIMFNCFENFVPEFCRLRCYKVVVKTRNFAEAMRFRDVMLAAPHYNAGLTPLQGKIGKDTREYTDGHFNGFIYADGLADALEKYSVVRDLIDKHIPDGPTIPVIIKRTCTEFERTHGPTNLRFWDTFTDEDRYFQSHIEDIYAGLKCSSIQPDWLQNQLISEMVEWANTVGDKSWMEYLECDDYLTMKAVTYHHLAQKEVQMEKINPTGDSQQQ